MKKSREGQKAKPWVSLEHHIYRELKPLKLKHVLVACSGGLDSVVLAYVLKRLQSALHLDLELLHFHHGLGEPKQLKYRDKTQRWVEAFGLHHGLQVQVFRHKGPELLRSESDLRKFRRHHIQVLVQKGPVVAMGHHRDDLLETRFMRLLRGTGPMGLLAMQSLKNQVLRPFLQISKQDLQEYAQEFELEWIEDPSNEEMHYLRNALRKRLQILEEIRPGALKNLSRSLELLAEKGQRSSNFEGKSSMGHRTYLQLSKPEKHQWIAACYLHFCGNQFTSGQVFEVSRQLDRDLRSLKLVIGQLQWRIEAGMISVLPLGHKSK